MHHPNLALSPSALSPNHGQGRSSQRQSPWSSLIPSSPHRSRFPATVLATLIRKDTRSPLTLSAPFRSPGSTQGLSNCSPGNQSAHSIPAPGEDLSNFVWDVDSSLRKANDDDALYEIARFYQPSIAKRNRALPPPILTRLPNATESPSCRHLSDPQNSGPTPSPLKYSINRLLRKRTHLKQSSQSSSSTSPSDNLADSIEEEHTDYGETEEGIAEEGETGEVGYYSQLSSPYQSPLSLDSSSQHPTSTAPTSASALSSPAYSQHHQSSRSIRARRPRHDTSSEDSGRFDSPLRSSSIRK